MAAGNAVEPASQTRFYVVNFTNIEIGQLLYTHSEEYLLITPLWFATEFMSGTYPDTISQCHEIWIINFGKIKFWTLIHDPYIVVKIVFWPHRFKIGCPLYAMHDKHFQHYVLLPLVDTKHQPSSIQSSHLLKNVSPVKPDIFRNPLEIQNDEQDLITYAGLLLAVIAMHMCPGTRSPLAYILYLHLVCQLII